MKPYGMTLRDHRKCVQGCCAGNYEKLSGHPSAGIRAKKKSARQQAKAETHATVTD